MDGKIHEANKLQELWMSEAKQNPDAPLLTKQFLSMMAKDSQLRDKLESFQKPKSDSDLAALSDCMCALKDIARRKLNTTVEDEQQNKVFRQNLTARLKKSEEDLANLQERLDEIQRSKEEDIAALDNSLKTLKGELMYLRQTNDKEAASFAKEMDSLSSVAVSNHESCMKDLTEKLQTLRTALKEKMDHINMEDAQLRKKHKTAKLMLQTVIDNYDTEIQAEYEELVKAKRQHESEVIELANLRKHFRKIDAEKKVIEEEERVIREEEEREQAKLRVKDRAARRIQRLMVKWYESKHGKKKKGKGKKGKKGKGKKGKKKKK
eukprot:g969.t1